MPHRHGAGRSAGVVAGMARRDHGPGPVGVRGGFGFDLADGSWYWSPGMYTLHGYRPGQVPGLTLGARLMLRHCYHADRTAVRSAWRRHLIIDGGLVTVHYRVLGADGVTRQVLVLASPVHAGHRGLARFTGVMELD